MVPELSLSDFTFRRSIRQVAAQTQVCRSAASVINYRPMIIKEPSPNLAKLAVTFEYPSTVRVQTVHLVGDFNDWSETATAMQRDNRSHVWRITLELDKGREYHFRYLVDQTTWHNDWHADEYIPNIHGSDDSVVRT